jgi:hypothetical protein
MLRTSNTRETFASNFIAVLLDEKPRAKLRF